MRTDSCRKSSFPVKTAMADDGDEDVVFQNSALYDHLQNVGFQNEDIDPEHRHTQPMAQSIQPQANTGNPSLPTAFFRHLHASLLTWLGMGDEWQQQQKGMDRKWGDEVCKVALSKDALEPEDAEFIQNVAEVQHQQDDTTDNIAPTSSRYGLERLLSVCVGVTAYTTARLFYPRVTVMTLTYDWIVGLFGILLLLPPSIRFLRTWLYRRQQARMLRAFSAVIVAAERWRKITRRSIRLVQEMELVARGFTLVSRVSPAERLEAGSLLEARRQCPELRRFILLTSRDLMIQMRNATNQLIQAWPLGAEIETMYLCQVSLEEYGAIITTTDEELLVSSTDNFGLTHIKAVVEICNLQLSEYVKRSVLMCLILPPDSAKSGAEVFEASLPTAISELSQATVSVQKSYNVHHCELLTDRASRSELKESSQDADTRQRHVLGHTYTAVHSLDLHLQTALRRARAMGDELEALCANDTTMESALKKRLEADLNKIKADLDSCLECWDEASVHVGKSGGRPNIAVPVSPVDGKKDMAIPEKDPIALFEMGDPVVPDQVFEAYTEENEHEPTDWGPDELLNPEEKEKKKQEKKEALRLLKELKSVIAVRAADWDEREERARQRMGGDSIVKPTLSDNTKDITKPKVTMTQSKETGDASSGDKLETYSGPPRVSPSRQRSSRSSEESGDTDQRELARQDCVHTCGEDSEDNNTEEMVDDLHEDLVNLAPTPPMTAVFESRSDDEDIFGGTGDFSDDGENENDPDRVDPANVKDPVAAEVRLAALKDKLSQEPGAGLGFSASAVAALAAQRSQVFGQSESQTFGDSDSDNEGVIES